MSFIHAFSKRVFVFQNILPLISEELYYIIYMYLSCIRSNLMTNFPLYYYYYPFQKVEKFSHLASA